MNHVFGPIPGLDRRTALNVSLRLRVSQSTILTIRDFGYLFAEPEAVASVVAKQHEAVWSRDGSGYSWHGNKSQTSLGLVTRNCRHTVFPGFECRGIMHHEIKAILPRECLYH